MNPTVALVPKHTLTPTSQIINITPELAESLLQRNIQNRRVKDQQVSTYVAQMLAGIFQSLNGQTIGIAGSLTTGNLLDGQHRLLAIVKSGVTLPFLVVTGLPETVVSTIDIGAKRTTGDLFDMKGITNGRLMSATLATYARLCARNDSEKSRRLDGALNSYDVTPDNIYQMYQEHTADTDEMAITGRNYWEKFRILGASQVAGMMLYTRLHSQYGDRAQLEFWQPLFNGGAGCVGMVEVCRNMLIEQLGKVKHKRMNSTDLVNAIIKTYNTHFGTPNKMIKVYALTNQSKTDKNFIFI